MTQDASYEVAEIVDIESDGDLTEREARWLTDDMKLDAVLLQRKVARAFQGRAWLALGYSGWDEYITSEFGGLRIRPPKESELEAIAELSAAGMSTREIAATYGISHQTVANRLEEMRPADTQESVKNLTPGSVQETSSKTGVPSASPVTAGSSEATADPAEREQRSWSYPSTEVRDPDSLSPDEALGGTAQLSKADTDRGAVLKMLRELHGSGSADVQQLGKTLGDLRLKLENGTTDPEAWQQDELESAAVDVAGAIHHCYRFLNALAASPYTNGVSLSALTDSTIYEQLDEIEQAHQQLCAAINRVPSTV